MKQSKLQRNIMRRVYYAYAISLTVHPMLWQGVFLGAAAVLLAHRLHVASIYHNFIATPVGGVPQYVMDVVLSAVGRGEVLLLLTLVAVTIVGLSALYQILQSLPTKRLTTHSA